MPKEAISQGFTGTQKGISYVGNHAYANSGLIVVNQNLTTLMSFDTGPAYVTAKFQALTDGVTGDNFELKVNFNGETVLGTEYLSPYENNLTGQAPYELLIPPYTNVTLTLQNIEGTSALNWYANLWGRVYG